LKRRRGRPVVLIILLVIAASLFFGQVLGSFYLGNISRGSAGENGLEGITPSWREGTKKKKVLRLNQFDYYSVQAGAFSSRETALLLGNSLARKGLPAVIAGQSPCRVLVGFLNNREKLLGLAESITVDGSKAAVVQGQVNSVSFKFTAGDKEAEEDIAPFLGRLSTCLHKGLLLYSNVDIEGENMKEHRPRFGLLARELEELGRKGRSIAGENKQSAYSAGVLILAGRCENWAASLLKLEETWQGTQMLISQQQALALLEDYHSFMAESN
jgi:hypothetical protein